MSVRYISNHRGSAFFREDELVELAKALKVNVGTDASADVGPVVSVEVETYLQNFRIILI